MRPRAASISSCVTEALLVAAWCSAPASCTGFRRFLHSIGAGDDRQMAHINVAQLARETEGASSRLLLRESTNLMALRVVDGHLPVDVNGEALGGGKIGVADFVLCSEAGRDAKIRRPPIRLVRPVSNWVA
jgi:hypothetical protein